MVKLRRLLYFPFSTAPCQAVISERNPRFVVFGLGKNIFKSLTDCRRFVDDASRVVCWTPNIIVLNNGVYRHFFCGAINQKTEIIARFSSFSCVVNGSNRRDAHITLRPLAVKKPNHATAQAAKIFRRFCVRKKQDEFARVEAPVSTPSPLSFPQAKA